jgi:hypothetical protein
MSENSGLDITPGMSDDTADTMFGSGVGQSADRAHEDGQPVGAADRAADEHAGDAPADEGDGMFGGGLLDDEPSTVEGGEAVGEADRAADVDRSR